jgi:DNA polymerase
MRCQDIGPPDAKIVLIGEAPGEEEERYGVPFYHKAAAGSMLRNMLSHAGIDFNRCYVTNVMDVRPPGNKFKYFYDGKLPSKELEQGWQRLREKVEAIRPDVIIPLGKEPLKALCNKETIGDWRGTWLSFRGINVLPTYHPSYICRIYKDHPIMEMDLVKAVRDKPAEEPYIVLSPTIDKVTQWLHQAALRKQRVSFDIETVGRHVRCIAVALGTNVEPGDGPPTTAICIPFIRFPSSELAKPFIGSSVVKLSTSGDGMSSYWTANEEVAVLDAIDKLFMSGIEVVGQNSICFDEPLLRAEFGLGIANHYMDTMHAFHCLYPEFPMSLNFLTSIYTNYSNYWTEKDTSNDMSEWRYNSMDAVVTLEVSYKIEQELREAAI